MAAECRQEVLYETYGELIHGMAAEFLRRVSTRVTVRTHGKLVRTNFFRPSFRSSGQAVDFLGVLSL